jgi:transcriptional regulator with XRE-family HTH domain
MEVSKPADLARLVKSTRQIQGRTQQDVADAAGITRQSLSRIEGGHGGVSFDTVLLILDYLGIRLSGRRDGRVAGLSERFRPSELAAAITRGETASLAVLKRVGDVRVAELRAAIDAGDPDRRAP